MSDYRIFAANSHPTLAQEVAHTLGAELGKCTVKRFSCGETYVNYDESIRGKDVFIVGTMRPDTVHDDMFELILMADAAHRSFANRVHVIVPHFAYSRQDKLHAPRESISMRVIADIFSGCGSNHIITVHLHADQTQAFFSIPVDNISPRQMFAQHFKDKNLSDAVVVSPDAGGAKTAKKFADMLGVDLAILHKSRPAHNEAEVQHIVGDIDGKTCIIIDDMIDTAGSVCGAKKALIENGANPEVYLCATHPVFSGPAAERLSNANFAEIVVTDTLPLEGEKANITNIHQLSMAPFLANVVQNAIEGKSVSQLFY